MISESFNDEPLSQNISNELSIRLDIHYNLAICSDCYIGLPLEWIVGHWKSNHGTRTTLKNVFNSLNINVSTMSLAEAQEWLNEVEVLINPIDGIPIEDGFACTICNYASKTLKVFKNHFNICHYNEKWSDWIEECKVQKPFNGQLHKYIRVRVEAHLNLESSEEVWLSILRQDFNLKMGKQQVEERSNAQDLRLMNAFIAKTRWDLEFEKTNGKALVDLTAPPSAKDKLHKVLVYAKKYIGSCCEKLNKGNMIIKRKLMCIKYNILLKIY